MSSEESPVWFDSEKLTTEVEGFEGKLTIPENFEAAVEKYKDKVLYRFRNVIKQHIELTVASNKKLITYEYGPTKTLTYEQTFNMAKALSSGIMRYAPDLKPKSRVGIYLNTCLEWALSLQAILRAGMTVTTVYATLGWESLVECLNESELEVIICHSDNVQNMDLNLGGGKCPNLKKLILVGDIHYRSKYFEMKTIWELIQDGFANPVQLTAPGPDDLAILMYTSGTTGSPKGVMMKHRNVIAATSGFTRRLKFGPKDVHFSYLPFAHIFEMAVHCSVLFSGGEIAFGTPRTLFAKPGGAKNIGDIEFAKPTIFCGVPKVWETLRKGVSAKVRSQGKMEQFMFNLVMMKKMELLRQGINEKVKFDAAGGLPLEDVVFKKVRLMLGGNLRVLVSGGAPLNPGTQYFLQACLGPSVSVIQGYGLTETCAGATVQFLNEKGKKYCVSNIGNPLSCVQLKLASVPEMNYSVKNDPPQGELCIRGPHITQGYFKKEGLTKAAYDEDGWFHTGDIVQRNKDDSISIIDRKKNLVKLSHGEYVAVEAVEVVYGLSNFIAPNGICVHVDPLQDHVVGIVLPDPIFAKQFAAKNNLGTGDVNEIIKKQEYVDALCSDLLKIADREKLKKYEILDKGRFVLKNDLWMPQNGLLTAASKLKRRALREKYQGDYDMMYGGELKKKKEEEEEEESEGEDVDLKKKKKMDIPQFFSLIKPNFV